MSIPVSVKNTEVGPCKKVEDMDLAGPSPRIRKIAMGGQAVKEKFLAKYGADAQRRNRERTKAWTAKNPERHSESVRRCQERYKETQDARLRAWQHTKYHRRQARKKSVEATLTSAEWAAILRARNNRCAYCGIEFSDSVKATQDHVVPLSRGGPYTNENIVPACRSCNSRKHARTPGEAGMPSPVPTATVEPLPGTWSPSVKRSEIGPYRGLRNMDLTESEPRIRKIAWEWARTISTDGAVDLDDLMQELRWRYWAYWNEAGRHPTNRTMREWAREAMTDMGYGRDKYAENPHFLRRRPDVVLAGDLCADIDEEEFLDRAEFRRDSRYAVPTSQRNQAEEGWE